MRVPWLRPVERGARTALVRGARALLARDQAPPLPDWDARPYRVLYVRHDEIGDMILATGLLRALAAAHPSFAIDVLTLPKNVPVLGGNEHVGQVLTIDRRRPQGYAPLARRIRRARYDAVIDGMVLRDAIPTVTALVMLASGARYRVGMRGRRNDFLYTHAVEPPDGVHHAELCGALAAPFGVDCHAADWRPEIRLDRTELEPAARRWAEPAADDAGAGRTRLLVNVSAGHPRRRWPDDRYAAVLRAAREREPGLRALVIGSPNEVERVRAIAGAGTAAPAPTPRLRDALALVATADCVLTPDTSIVHAASAFRTPGVVITLPRARAFGLYRTPGRHIVSDDPTTLGAIPVEPVAGALAELLAELRSARAAAPAASP